MELDIRYLDLSVRSYHCLKNLGVSNFGKDLTGLKLGELLKIKGFGIISLIDVLTALEPMIALAEAEATERQRKQSEAFKEILDEEFDRKDRVSQSDRSSKIMIGKLLSEAKRIRRSRWARRVTASDPRLGNFVRALGPQAPTVRGFVEQILSGKYRPKDPVDTLRRLRDLSERARQLSRLAFEEELMGFIPVTNDRNKKLVSRRFGWDGAGGATLQEVGDEFGITRERVRQVCSRVEKRLEGQTPFAPVLDRILLTISQCPLSSADQIEFQLKANGLTQGLIRLEGILNAAALLGRDVTFGIDETHGKRVALPADRLGAARVVVQTARRSIEHWGVATTEDVAAQASEKLSTAITTEFVAHLLKDRTDFRWLDESGGWFLLISVPRNRLLNQIRKILAVAEGLEVSELRSGVCRHHRMKGVAPPQRVLLEFCREISWCHVDGKRITAEAVPNWREVLSDTEQLFVDVLMHDGPVMQRVRLEELCVARGMNRTTFYMYLEYSPILNRYAPGVYGLRGANVSSADIQVLIPKIRRGRVMKDYGWTENGQVWIAYSLSAAMIHSGVATLPAGIKHYVEGSFSLKAEDGLPVGTLVAAPGNVWGFGPFFRRRGGEPGDYLLVTLDLSKREATLRIGDASLLDRTEKTSESSVVS